MEETEQTIERQNVFHSDRQGSTSQCQFCGQSIEQDQLLQWVHSSSRQVLCNTRATPTKIQKH